MSDDDTCAPPRIADECFRLLRLTSEVQNDEEVVKPVLEELEVLRLSCALGMLTSVNAKDFDMRMLEAREFDDDFARFLRQKVLSGSSSTDEQEEMVTTVCLFGTQLEVKRQLVQWDCWSSDCEKNLHERDQGVYAVHKRTEAGLNSGQVLVLFAWLQNELLDPQGLRGTATYVLRFLTCLSSHVICCLSEADLPRIQHEVEDLSTKNKVNWQAFSVAFHVEHQEDEQDGVQCHIRQKLTLPFELNNKGSDIHMVTGGFPALAVMRPVPSTTAKKHTRMTFDTSNKFVEWIRWQSQQYKLKLSPDFVQSNLRDMFLRAMGAWPQTELEANEAAFHQSLRDCEAKNDENVAARVNERRLEMIDAGNVLFSVDVLANPKEAKRISYILTSRLRELKRNGSTNLDMDIILTLPFRLCQQMEVLSRLDETSLETALYGLQHELTVVDLEEFMKRKWFRRLSGAAIKTFSSWFLIRTRDNVDVVSLQFRDRMAEPLAQMKDMWLKSVDTALKSSGEKMRKHWLETDKESIRQTHEDNCNLIIRNALSNLLQIWQNNDKFELAMSVEARKTVRGVVCAVTQDEWNPPAHHVEVFKLVMQVGNDAKPDFNSLGSFAVREEYSLLRLFTVKHSCVLAVSTSSSGTLVEHVKFPVESSCYAYRGHKSKVTAAQVRSFGRVASHCDLNLNERMMAFGDKKGVISVYRLSENFTSMECMRTIELSLHMSLSPPIFALRVLANFVVASDCNGTAQDRRKIAWSSDIFSLSDGLVLGRLIVRHINESLHGEIHAISSDDHRTIPVRMVDNIYFDSTKGLSVGCFKNWIYVIDAVANTVQIIRLDVTIRSNSYRILHSSQRQVSGAMQSKHWLWTFYHMFDKFPVCGLLSASEASHSAVTIGLSCQTSLTTRAEADCESLMNYIMSRVRKLNKPLYALDLTNDLEFTFGRSSLMASANKTESQQIRSCLRDVITIVPVQICRADKNSLIVLVDGEDKGGIGVSDRHQSLQSVDIARSMRFGLLSPLLESWRGQCIVVTSMGKQSTGKSYFLNHLAGSSFAIAGARCTDGAWMTIRVLPHDVLLVVLDFEGLGSFERTEQEDVFLSLLNAALSSFTIFRIEMRFDKDIDGLFSRFQRSVKLIKNDPLLFRGKLCKSVKDVNPDEQENLFHEFVKKFEGLLESSKGHNFLTDLYGGKVDLNCSPPLGTDGYFESLEMAQDHIEHELCQDQSKGFRSGRAFLDCMRLVLAKISILDWTSLDKNAEQLLLVEAKSKLPGIIRTGCIVPQQHVSSISPIVNDVKEEIKVDEKNYVDVSFNMICAKYPAMALKWTALNDQMNIDTIQDQDIDFGVDCTNMSGDNLLTINASMCHLFEGYLSLREISNSSRITVQMQTDFDVYLSYLIHRRKLRIAIWANLVFNDSVPKEWNLVETELFGRFQAMCSRCDRQCDSCLLGCMHSRVHYGSVQHECCWDHVCQGYCEYCDLSTLQVCDPPRCAKQAGHEGTCECSDGDHTCAEPCCLNGSSNCGMRCALKRGHDAELHHCAVQLHTCGKPCGAEGCNRRCSLNFEVAHNAHKCVKDHCNQKCIMEGCSEYCASNDHFHGQAELSVTYMIENGQRSKEVTAIFDRSSLEPVIHMCLKKHSCQATCSEDGLCSFEVNQKQEEKVLTGQRDPFFIVFEEMHGLRKKCAVVMDPGQQSHEGRHSCTFQAAATTNCSHAFHHCEARCPCCSYYCDKPFGHGRLHKTLHGNMRNTYFVSDEQYIDVGGRKYAPGDSGMPEMCQTFCSTRGRGHVHYLDCEQGRVDSCVYIADLDQRRHCTHNLEPKPEKDMDEMLHAQFWNAVGWEDPVQSADSKDLFAKCSFKCDAPEHIENDSFCILPAWHKAEIESLTSHDGFSYINGHKFNCDHVSTGGMMHHVFVLDCSGSMVGSPWENLLEEWRAYMRSRIRDGASLDLVSVVTFDDEAKMEYEERNITTMVNASVAYRGGSTKYVEGLRTANEVLSRNRF